MADVLSNDALLRALRAEGCRVVEYRDWRTHRRPSRTGSFGPINGVMIHHTVTSGTANSVELCYNGYSSLPGPLCHGVIAKDGTVYLISNGRANHAGSGDDDVLRAVINESATLPPDNEANTDGNRHFYGFECINMGDGKDPWPAAQLEAIEKAAAAICRTYGWSERSVIGHLEWQPGKVDPRGFSMEGMRRRIRDRLGRPAGSASAPSPPKQEESGMQMNDIVKVTGWIKERWPDLADGEISVNTALASGYAHGRAANENTAKILDRLDQVVARPLDDDQIAAIAQAVATHPALAEAIANVLAARLAD